jgi:hypothetical protein
MADDELVSEQAKRRALERAARLLAEHGGPWSEVGPSASMLDSLVPRLLDEDGRRAAQGMYRIAVKRHYEVIGQLIEASELIEAHHRARS